jgi:adenylate kinase family enzyme
MKFYETHFENYLLENKRFNLHPKLDKIYESLPIQINKLKNIIFYGPSGIGKYTQALKCIKKYSPTELKYEKKITLSFNKQNYFFKISDVHFEIDMSLLGCNSKLLWHEIYQQIIDIISAKTDKSGIIVCKYFHEIHSELLDNFYSYMQKNYAINIDVIFFLITEEISFIPDNILNACEVIPISRPPKSMYNKFLKNKLSKNIQIENISNIKNLYTSNSCEIQPLIHYKIICDKILENMISVEEMNFLNFRDLLYDIFIYHLDITDCIWYILSILVEKNKINSNDWRKVMLKTYCFFQYYNNNYRPIYHLENYLLTIVQIIHGFHNINIDS